MCVPGLIAVVLVVAQPAGDPWIENHLADLTRLYKELHARPELSYHEAETARRVAEELRKAGADVTTGIGGHGVVGILRNGRGPTILVRSDLDALPVVEATNLPYASRAKTTDDAGNDVGVMHACGHDLHMTNLIGVAQWLVAHKNEWAGTILLVGQPAEERVGGAKKMLADGLYERFPKPDYALALHVSSDLETGKIGYRAGPALAGATEIDIVVKGRGGHGAAPNDTVDPIVLAALLVLDLQTIVSREIKPTEPAVVTVGTIHGGTKHNIIPNDVRLQLTIRAFHKETRDQLISAIRRRAKGLAQAHGAPEPTVTVGDGTPPTVNTPELVQRVIPALQRELGAGNVSEVEQVMGAEDFGLFGKGGVPTFMFRLGTIPPARIAAAASGGEPLPSLHSARYFPDPEPSLRTGIRAMTTAVRTLAPAR